MRYWEYRVLEVLGNTFPQRTLRYTRTVQFILSVNEKYFNFHIAHTNTTIGVDRISRDISTRLLYDIYPIFNFEKIRFILEPYNIF